MAKIDLLASIESFPALKIKKTALQLVADRQVSIDIFNCLSVTSLAFVDNWHE
ncbi:unnamed protein product, partial [Ceratitis capitata]